MSDEVPSPKPRRKGAKPFTQGDARDEILKKLGAKGASGVPALYSAKAPAAKLEVYERAITELEREREIYIDRRKAKPRFYLWSARPKLPTRESVAALIDDHLRALHPALASGADLKKVVSKEKEAVPFLFSAVELLFSEHRVVILRRKNPKGFDELYAHAASLREMLGISAVADSELGGEVEAIDPGSIRRSYEALVQRTGFPAVAISALQGECNLPLESLKAWLKEQHQQGTAVLSFGDWSLADDAKRAAAIEVNGDRFLLVRMIL